MVFFAFVLLAVVSSIRGRAGQKERIKQAVTYNPANTHGSARFANNKDMRRASLFKTSGIRIGLSPDGRRKLFMNNSGHLLVCAGARTGKLVTVLCEAVLSLPKSYGLCIFDPKAEITCICAHYLKSRGRTLYVLNPFGIWLDRMKGLKLASFNPMSSLEPGPSFHSD